MFDARLRRLIDPPLDAAGRRLAGWGLSANATTLGGFVIGLAALPLLAAGQFTAALIVILLNRLADGLDGAIARSLGPSDLGGYLDILCDFLFYGAVVFGFVLAAPDNHIPGAFLLFSFIGTGSSFLAFAILAARHGWETSERGSQILLSPRRLDRRQRDHRLVRRRLPVPGGLSRARLDLRRRLLGDDARPGAIRLDVPEAWRRC